MICPTCQNLMIVVEHEQIELDYCPDCSGIWFDSGELELMLEIMGVADGSQFLGKLLASPEAETTEKKRKCPICQQKMKKTTIGEKPELVIDECLRGDGLWFDGGEVSRLITHHVKTAPDGSDSQQRILNFLEETFSTGNEPESE